MKPAWGLRRGSATPLMGATTADRGDDVEAEVGRHRRGRGGWPVPRLTRRGTRLEGGGATSIETTVRMAVLSGAGSTAPNTYVLT
jgi:hypothetical protein